MLVTAEAFGAVGDGITDDTASIQAALSSGASVVQLAVRRYLTTASLIVPPGVVLRGEGEGPFDPSGIAPGLLVTGGQGHAGSPPFLSLDENSCVCDLMIEYPHQAEPSAVAPVPYPWAIQLHAPGAKIRRVTIVNAYLGIDVEMGRTEVSDTWIGALLIGLMVDHAQDRVTLKNLIHSVFWDIAAGAAFPSALDTAFVLRQSYGFMFKRVDSIELHNALVFARYAGLWLGDSEDASQGIRCGYGAGFDLDLDTVQYGMIVQATNQPGYKFSNVDFGSQSPSGASAVYFQPGGSAPPLVLIHGGSIRGAWVTPFTSNGTGDLRVQDVFRWGGF